LWGKLKKVFNLVDSDIPYHAASLSFFTIFSMLPLIALLVAVITYLPIFETYSKPITTFIFEFVNPTHSQKLKIFLENFLTNTDKLGGIGILYLLFVFIIFFRDYEHTISKIYNVDPRPIHKVFLFYISFFITVPILYFIISIVDGFITFSYSQSFFLFLFGWSMFCILFFVSTKQKLSFKAIGISSFFTLIALSVTKTVFGYYVSLNTTYASIYGSFSIILFFFLWIYISWNIYLYGTKLCALLNKEFTVDKN
jgi:membrane protein